MFIQWKTDNPIFQFTQNRSNSHFDVMATHACSAPTQVTKKIQTAQCNRAKCVSKI